MKSKIIVGRAEQNRRSDH